MSSFICEKCKKEIIDSEEGYITECEHYPRYKLKLERLKEMMEGNNEVDYLKNLFDIKE